MLRIFTLLFIFIATIPVQAQLPVFQWAKAFRAHNLYNPSVNTNGRSVAVDRQGNVYSAGLMNYITDFDPGPGYFDIATLPLYETGIYISKLSPSGDFIWAIQIPVLVEFGNIEIQVDHLDNVYLASTLGESADFDPGPGEYIVKSSGVSDAFVAKYDSDGKFIWVRQFGGKSGTGANADVLDIDEANNVIICGNFSNTVDFDPGPEIYNISPASSNQSYVVKLNSDGEFIWAKPFGSISGTSSYSHVADVKCDKEGKIYLTGNFRGSCDFDPGPGSFTIQSKSYGDAYIVKLNANGSLAWAKSVGSNIEDENQFAETRAIDVDNDNNVYTGGSFTGTFDFDPGSGSHVVSSKSIYDWYVLKLNAQGEFLWVAPMGGYDEDDFSDLAVDLTGNIYAMGSIGPSADMDPGPGTYDITAIGNGTSVLVKLSSDGQLVYATPFDGNGASLFRRMAVDNVQNIYITGALYGNLDLDPGPGTFMLDDDGNIVPFVLKLGRCSNATAATLDISTCTPYKLNNETFDSSGTYIRSIPNKAGCDSVITLNLTITRKITEQTKTICDGESIFAGGALQGKAGVYTDSLQTVMGCDSIIVTHLIVNTRPVPDLGKDQDLCAGSILKVTPGSFLSYLWQDSSQTENYTIKSPGIYWVKVTNTYNCSTVDSIVIGSLLPLPEGFLKDKDSICMNETLELKPLRSFKDYMWSTGNTQKSLVIQQPGSYWLTVKDGFGCYGTDSIQVLTRQCLSGFNVPTGFTPNKDGKNDVFKPLISGNVMSYRFTIYNRWGEIIFQTNEYKKGWDGNFSGRLQQSDVYAWTCTFQLEGMAVRTEKGSVLLIR